MIKRKRVDEAAEQLIVLMKRFSKLIDIANEK